MYRVLVPVDENVHRASLAAETVTDLPCAAEEVEAVVLNVFEEFEVTDGEWESVDSEEIFDEEEFPDSVGVVEEYLQEAGVSVSRRREHGDPTEEILDVANEIDADSIVICGRRRRPVGKVLFGSVVESVMLAADQPVTVVLEEE